MKTNWRICALVLVAFILFSCKALPQKNASLVTITGRLVAFGNEPHVAWLIENEAGTLYLPDWSEYGQKPKPQSGNFVKWTGRLEKPRAALPGLVPKHEAVLVVVEAR